MGNDNPLVEPSTISATFKDRVTPNGKDIALCLARSISLPPLRPIHPSNQRGWYTFSNIMLGHYDFDVIKNQIFTLLDQGFVKEIPFIDALREQKKILEELDIELTGGREIIKLYDEPSEIESMRHALRLVNNKLRDYTDDPQLAQSEGNKLTYALMPALFKKLFIEATTNQSRIKNI